MARRAPAVHLPTEVKSAGTAGKRIVEKLSTISGVGQNFVHLHWDDGAGEWPAP